MVLRDRQPTAADLRPALGPQGDVKPATHRFPVRLDEERRPTAVVPAEPGGRAGELHQQRHPERRGTIVAEGAGRVRINLGIPNEYSWHASKQSLTFAKVKDSVQDRLAVFAGTWRRK